MLDSAHSDARTTYTVVEDPRVVENGFRVRWKMGRCLLRRGDVLWCFCKVICKFLLGARLRTRSSNLNQPFLSFLFHTDPSHHTALLHITSLTSLIPHYGSEDLRALLLALASDPALTPGTLRPEKAQEYLAREAKCKVEENGAGGTEEEAVRGVVTGNIEWTRKEEEMTVVGVGGKLMGVKVWGM